MNNEYEAAAQEMERFPHHYERVQPKEKAACLLAAHVLREQAQVVNEFDAWFVAQPEKAQISLRQTFIAGALPAKARIAELLEQVEEQAALRGLAEIEHDLLVDEVKRCINFEHWNRPTAVTAILERHSLNVTERNSHAKIKP